jgi:hypothetical protein
VLIRKYLKHFFKSRGNKSDYLIAARKLDLHFARTPVDAIQTLPEGRKVITAPTMVLPMSPSKSHKVLFVGAPVKIREMPEPAESDAFIP